MSDSEDDVDSEKFESADENLSESDVKSESFGQEAKPFQQEILDSDKTRRYRKRPERTSTATAAAPGSVKSKITERASSAISPDYPEKILKDVANQISKNIDKSLDGIIKTSSSLKDAVFGTFPGSQVESAKEKLGLFDEPENFSDQEIPEERTKSVFKQTLPKETIPDARDQNQRDEEESVSKVSKPENFSDREIPEERTESVCKQTTPTETIPDARDQNQQDEEESVSKVIQPLQSSEQVAESTTLPKGGEEGRKGNEQSVSELTPPPRLLKESTTLAKSEEREVKLGKETGIPAEKLVLETEPTSDLGTTEGWDDFDFDEDEAVILDTVSTEKIDSGSIDPCKTKSSSKKESVESSWGLSGWGVGSLLDTATAVTRGISTVLETGLGVPDPETLAASTKSTTMSVEQKETLMQDSSGFPNFGITSLVAGVTSKIVEKTKVQEIGSKVISGGLDTLENIGKKTMQVLQEGDPGLKKKKALLLGQPDKPVLSRILREAKEKAEMEDRILAEKEAARNCRFETLFDDFQGLVHLEALEMLSRQCELKLEQLRASSTEEEKQDLDGILAEVKELCDIEETEAPSPSDLSRFKFLIEETVEPLKSEISTAKIVQIHEEAKNWLAESEEENLNPKIVYRKAMSAMAELTAATAHQFHKAGELLAVKERRKTVEEAETLMQLTNILCAEVDSLSKTFSSRLEKNNQDDSSGVAVRTIKLESDNAVSYIKQAFNLLIPVLQLGAT